MEAEDKPLMPIPQGMTIREDTQSMTIEYKWFKIMFIFLIVFAGIWDTFILVFYVVMLREADLPIWALLVPSIHLLIGVGLSYYALAGLLNKTIIYVERETITISHKPMPWLGAQTIDRRDVQQLFVVQKQRRGKNGVSIAYNVNLVTKDHRSIKLVTGFEDSEQARFVERKIEDFFKIENKSVDGEWKN